MGTRVECTGRTRAMRPSSGSAGANRKTRSGVEIDEWIGCSGASWGGVVYRRVDRAGSVGGRGGGGGGSTGRGQRSACAVERARTRPPGGVDHKQGVDLATGVDCQWVRAIGMVFAVLA